MCGPRPSSRRIGDKQPSRGWRSGVACRRARSSASGNSSRRGSGRVTGGVRAGRVWGKAHRRGIVGEAPAGRKAAAGPWTRVARSAARRKAQAARIESVAHGGQPSAGRAGYRAVRRSCSGTVVIAEVDGVPRHLRKQATRECRRRKALRVVSAASFDEVAETMALGCPGGSAWCGVVRAVTGSVRGRAPSVEGGRKGRPRRSAGPEIRRSSPCMRACLHAV